MANKTDNTVRNADMEQGINEDIGNIKADSTHVDDLGPAEGQVANSLRPNPQKEAPMSVARLSHEERTAAEKALVRKIDLRLLPMLVIMYILNYLDRECDRLFRTNREVPFS